MKWALKISPMNMNKWASQTRRVQDMFTNRARRCPFATLGWYIIDNIKESQVNYKLIYTKVFEPLSYENRAIINL